LRFQALKAKRETCINMTIEKKHLFLMSTDKLYTSVPKKYCSTLRLHSADVNDIASPSFIS